MALVNVDIEDYLDEVDSDRLVRELNSRGYKIKVKEENEDITDEKDFTVHFFYSPQKAVSYLKKFMGLREFHDNDRLLLEIVNLF